MANTSSGGTLESSFQFASVTKSDTVPLSYVNVNGETEYKRCKALYIGGAGNLTIKNDAGTAITFTGVTAGSVYPVSTTHVMNATTATSIVALY